MAELCSGRSVVKRFLKVDSDCETSDSANAFDFLSRATIQASSLIEVIDSSAGAFTHVFIDIRAIMESQDADAASSIVAKVGDEILDQRHLLKWYSRTQLIIPLAKLYNKSSTIELIAETVAGTPRKYRSHLYFCSWDRILDHIERKSIWVFSAPRSGSSWLALDILCSHEGVRPIDEPGLGRLLAPLELEPERFHNLAARKAHFESGFEYETRRKARSALGVAPFVRHLPELTRTEPMENIRHGLHAGVFTKHIRELMLGHVTRVWSVLDAKKYVFKVPAESYAAEEIQFIFPNSFFLYLMRDGRDVLRSLFSPFVSAGLATTKDPDLRLYAIAFYAHFWNFQVDIIQSAFDRHPEERKFFVRYEDLRREPERLVHEVLQKVGHTLTEDELLSLIESKKLENLNADQKGPDKARQQGKIGGYKTTFSTEEVELMNAIMGPNLVNYGYSVDS